MKLVKFNVLSPVQINDINELNSICADCSDSDYTYEPYYEEFSGDNIDCFYLAYEGETLTAFVSVLLLGNEGEVTGIVHPEYRRKGVFKWIINSIMDDLSQYNIFNLYGSIPDCIENSSLNKCSLFSGSSHTEFLLIYRKEFLQNIPPVPYSAPTINKTLTHYYKTDYFNESVNIAGKYILKSGNRHISSCKLSEELSFTNIWNVETKKPYRCNGYGFGLINYVINDYFSNNDKPLILNVTSRNPAAYTLYIKCGFHISEKIDYYRFRLTDT